MGNQDFMRLITGGLAGSPRQASGSPRLSYGPDLLDDYPRAADYVDRILAHLSHSLTDGYVRSWWELT